MDRQYYLDLAAGGQRMALGTDLVLHEKSEREGIVLDGARLGDVFIEAAGRYGSPLAMPLMNLELEKLHLLDLLGVQTADPATWHFSAAPGPAAFQRLTAHLADPLSPCMEAFCQAIRRVADTSDLVPVGMSIGPFSLATQLLSDPITPIAMAGLGLTVAECPDIRTVEEVLELSVRVILRYLQAQIDAGARLVVICEPAANSVYLSPNQIAQGSDIFERFVMSADRRIKKLLLENDVDLFFHDCGELTDTMIQSFATLDPAILSLGSSRRLWEDARLLPRNIVLFGNLPSKRFFSDTEITREQVAEMSRDLVEKMQRAQHPFILATECDVLCVPGCEHVIAGKVQTLLTAGRTPVLRHLQHQCEAELAAASSS